MATSVVLVTASTTGSWRGAVMPGSAGVVFAATGAFTSSAFLAIAGAAVVLLGGLRWAWWARVCTTSQLVDDGEHLVWMYRGERREAVAWADLRHVVLQRWARQVVWAIGPNSGGPFPFVLVDSRVDPPPSGFRWFAEVMVIHRPDLEAADRALETACRRRGITYHGVWSGW